MIAQADDALVIDGDLAAMAGLTEWVDGIAARWGFSEKMQFAAKLCLEESVSNSIRHGYGGSGGQVRIRFEPAGTQAWVFTVEDDATPFNPLEQPELPAISPDTLEIGGQGIRLMRSFATSLEYEPTPTGNRLRVGFARTEPEADAPRPASL